MRAAIYESDITPPLGGYMWGSLRDRRAEDVYNKLYSKALVIEQDDEYAILISVDVCDYPQEMTEIVTKRIFEYTGITSERVCISSTHTHHGAPVSDSPEINCFGDQCYKDVFFRLIADSAILAFRRLSESELLFGKIEVQGIANCRCAMRKDGTLATHCKAQDIDHLLGNPDHELPILFIEQGGKKIGALYAFGCHQDTVGINPQGYTGDYSSIVADILKEKYGRDFVSIYVPGPSGDINHINQYEDYDKRKNFREIGSMLAKGIEKAESNAGYISGKLIIMKEQIQIKKRKYDNEQFKNLVIEYANAGLRGRLGNLVYYHRADKTEYADLYVQIIAIGELAIYVYPGELFSQYSHRTKENSPFKYNMVVANSNSHGGYIPTPDAFGENSKLLYEAAPSSYNFLVPEAGEILYDKIMNMASEMHKK